MRPFVPRRLEFVLFGAMLSGMMSLIVAGITTLRAIGLAPDFVSVWLTAWLASWVLAFPSVLVVAPFVRAVLHRIVIKAEPHR